MPGFMSTLASVPMCVVYRIWSIPAYLAQLLKNLLMPRIKCSEATKINMMDYRSRNANARQPNQIRSLVHLVGKPDVVWMAGGFPNPSLFPITQLSFTTQSGIKCELDAMQLAKAQQYTLDDGGTGYAPLRKWICDHMAKYHNPPYTGWDSVVCAGNSDAPMRIMDSLLDPGDSILCEEYAFVHSFSQLRPWGDAKDLFIENILFTPGGPDIEHMRYTLANCASRKS